MACAGSFSSEAMARLTGRWIAERRAIVRARFGALTIIEVQHVE
jgi:hypothetical protein